MLNQKKPKVFVGTLYSGEGDFTHCAEAVVTQKNVYVQQHVIANLPEKDAHNQLWNMWRTAKNEFDMFVKIDADTVLSHKNVLYEFWKMMEDNPRITGIQAPLLDYYTQEYINGLNCFSPRVTFLNSNDDLFCDRRVDVDHDIVVKADAVVQELKPAGRHCFYATEVQSYHFGLHRMLKGQINIINRVKELWLADRAIDGNDFTYDDKRSFVMLGSIAAKDFKNGHFNYTDPQLLASIEKSYENRYNLLSVIK